MSAHHSDSRGVWLVLAKKGARRQTELSYDEALAEAICFGWIDGQLGRRDDETFRRRFTPRKAGSAWSRRNVLLAEGLISMGRMLEAGQEEVRRAQADGRWESAYAGQASAEVPEALAIALAKNPLAGAMFEQLTSANRYAIVYRIATAMNAKIRARRIESIVEMLARGETFHRHRSRTSE